MCVCVASKCSVGVWLTVWRWPVELTAEFFCIGRLQFNDVQHKHNCELVILVVIFARGIICDGKQSPLMHILRTLIRDPAMTPLEWTDTKVKVHSACTGALNVVAKAGCRDGVRDGVHGVFYFLDI
jgi:hypothetical protein